MAKNRYIKQTVEEIERDEPQEESHLDMDLIKEAVDPPTWFEIQKREIAEFISKTRPKYTLKQRYIRLLLSIIQWLVLIVAKITTQDMEKENSKDKIEAPSETLTLEDFDGLIERDKSFSGWFKRTFNKPQTATKEEKQKASSKLDEEFVALSKNMADSSVNSILEKIGNVMRIHLQVGGEQDISSIKRTRPIPTKPTFDTKRQERNTRRKKSNKYFPLIKKGQIWHLIEDNKNTAKITKVEDGLVGVTFSKGKNRKKSYTRTKFYEVFNRKGREFDYRHTIALRNQFMNRREALDKRIRDTARWIKKGEVDKTKWTSLWGVNNNTQEVIFNHGNSQRTMKISDFKKKYRKSNYDPSDEHIKRLRRLVKDKNTSKDLKKAYENSIKKYLERKAGKPQKSKRINPLNTTGRIKTVRVDPNETRIGLL